MSAWCGALFWDTHCERLGARGVWKILYLEVEFSVQISKLYTVLTNLDCLDDLLGSCEQ